METRIRRERLTPRELDVIVELTDNEGYTQKELIEKTGIIKYNLSAYLTDFEQDEIVYRKIETDKKKARGNKGSDIYYYIGPKDTATSQEKLNIFQLILKSSSVELESDLQKNLLAKLLAPNMLIL
jgi:DNA-binding MarR family transcriptional regulator